MVCVQGNCSAPTTQAAERMGLTEATVTGMQAMLPGQCVVVIDSSWLQLTEGNKWLDNVHVVIAPDKIERQITAVALTPHNLWPRYNRGLNIFISRMTFQSSHWISARAVGVHNVQLTTFTGCAGSSFEVHSILVQSAIQHIIRVIVAVMREVEKLQVDVCRLIDCATLKL